MVAPDKLRSLHKLLWHNRDEAGNKRLKQRLSEAIQMVDDIIIDNQAEVDLGKLRQRRKT